MYASGRLGGPPERSGALFVGLDQSCDQPAQMTSQTTTNAEQPAMQDSEKYSKDKASILKQLRKMGDKKKPAA